ncbi:von Willebrand factor D and EGF domain-containing protein-like [Mizuhopecten yessoensis]|uniref:von Willebrand factor D and EGF domain-containing protein n=1 Tax=Mizuhopecten yessoensis TaxID=6573 RepID=A0A210PJS2_MIZYE|nr:von Willebrand factor D and EGF domain-containing protein-like [Mizuhopecten yessoensis]OWF36676.1 von Willebrand factor D and EGF domain-containing protein [Mizuhopecten yessoensis]
METLLALSLCIVAVAAIQDPCTNYRDISEPHRSVAFIPEGTDRLICDHALIQGWYKFANGDMPTSCVPTYHCGTNAPIWFNGHLPSVADGIITGKACINFGQASSATAYGGSSCCHHSLPIQIKNCGAFNVYHLARTPACFMAYCAGNQHVCPIGQTNIGSNKCMDLYPKMTHFPTLGQPYIDPNNHVQFPCHIPFPKGEPDVAFDVTWTVDGQMITDPNTNAPVVTTLTGDNRDALLDSIHMEGHMGKTLKCNVTSYHATSPGIKSDTLSSNGFWAGIRASTNAIIVDEKGAEQEVTLESTVPIPCNDPHKQACSVSVEMMSSKDPFDISTSSCTYDLKYDNVSHTYKATIKVTATRDFVKDGDQVHELAFRPLLTWQSPMFNGYNIHPIQVTSRDRPHALCSASGDPHFRQIDRKGRLDVYEVGDFIMYKSTTRPFEIQIRTWSCGHYNPCICAIVAREGNDVVSIDMCEKRKNQLAAPDVKILSNGPLHSMTIDRDTSGKNFFLNFASGTRLTVGAHTTDYHHTGEIDGHMSLSLQSPTDDIEKAEGLCGTFDGRDTNDLEGADHKIYDSHHIRDFYHSWLLKPGTSMFDALPLFNTRYDRPESLCKCDHAKADCTKSKGNNPGAKNCNGKCTPFQPQGGTHPRDLDFPFEAPVKRDFNTIHIRSRRSFPTPSGITEAMATTTCTTAIHSSSLYNRCRTVLASEISQHYIDACVEDMMFADGDEFNLVHMNSFDIECQDAVLRDVSNYAIGLNKERIPPTDVTTHMCSNQCSRRGTCHEGTCTCQTGYTGADCSVPEGVAPVVSHLRGDGLCDFRDRPCMKVQVIAQHLMDGPGLKCRYQAAEVRDGSLHPYGSVIEAPAKFISFLEVECSLPPSDVATRDSTVGGFMVAVTANRLQYSTPKPFVVFDGSCQVCDVTGNCTLKDNTCLIDNSCRAPGEQNAEHTGYCSPSSDAHSWTSGAAITEINHYTSTGSGCQCGFDKTRFDCACCTNNGCQCGDARPHICTSCGKLDSCSAYPDIDV